MLKVIDRLSETSHSAFPAVVSFEFSLNVNTHIHTSNVIAFKCTYVHMLTRNIDMWKLSSLYFSRKSYKGL